jgi:hypothetical protein
MTELVALPEPTPEERELSRKIAELAELEATLAGRERALAKLETELHVFEIHYLATVGKQYAALDLLDAQVAELRAALAPGNLELLEQAEAARARAQESADAVEGARTGPERRAGPPPESLKQLFRKVARVIHPDHAEDEAARAKRQELMAAANRAYETGDESRLAALLQEWDDSPEAVTGHSPAAELLRAVRQVARAQERIEAVDREIAARRESELFLLREQVEREEAMGRDLLREMAAAIEPQLRERRALLETLRQGASEP